MSIEHWKWSNNINYWIFVIVFTRNVNNHHYDFLLWATFIYYAVHCAVDAKDF